MSDGSAAGTVVMDLRGLQGDGGSESPPRSLLRNFVAALERRHPDLVSRYLLGPDLPPPDDLADLVPPVKTVPFNSPDAFPSSSRVYHSLSVVELDAPLRAIWPQQVEQLGLRFSATVKDLALLEHPETLLPEVAQQRRCRARCQLLRFADGILTWSEATRSGLADLLDVDPGAVTVIASRPLEDGWRAASDESQGQPLVLWDEVADRSAEALHRLGERPRRSWHRPLRLALVSPFPPVPSGVARYSARLAAEAARQLAAMAPGAALDCFADARNGPSSDAEAFADGADVRSSCDTYDACSLPAVEGALGGYDGVVCVIGNSEYHRGAVSALRRRGGVVMAHEVRLTNLMRRGVRRDGSPSGQLVEAIRRAYGEEAVDPEARRLSASAEEIDRLGALLLREIVGAADQVLVSSEAARRLAERDVGPDLSSRLDVLPFAMALDESELELIDAARSVGDTPLSGARPLVAAFGIVDPAKLPRLVIEGAALLPDRRRVDVAFVGPASADMVHELTDLAAELGMADRVMLTGAVDRSVYLEFLGRASVAVQLRAGFGGEASAAVGDCLAAGLPTVVSNVGWLAELPNDVVMKLERTGTAEALELRDCLLSLLDEPAAMAVLGERAAGYAAEHTFARTAGALLNALRLSNGARRSGRPAAR